MNKAYVDDIFARALLEEKGHTNRKYKYHLTESGRSRHEEIFRQLVREVFELYGRLKHELRVASGDEPGAIAGPEAQSA
jgi:hypothetical protein